MLYNFPSLQEENLKSNFNSFPWEEDHILLKKWEKGLTGYPIVDAGMRELWETGYMHNRVRMITSSFLVKNLLLNWKHGKNWFWDCLLDADAASNSASWQWVAGTGTDATPFLEFLILLLNLKNLMRMPTISKSICLSYKTFLQKWFFLLLSMIRVF